MQSQQTQSAGTKISTKALRALLEEQDYKCAITGDELTPDNARLDHIVPVSRGGANIMENVWLVTEYANKLKNTLTITELVELCRKVIAKHG